MKLINKCSYCNSIWVCWNWMHFSKETIKNYPHKEPIWAHECWSCSAAFNTSKKILFGVPYWLLRFVWKFKKVKEEDIF